MTMCQPTEIILADSETVMVRFAPADLPTESARENHRVMLNHLALTRPGILADIEPASFTHGEEHTTFFLQARCQQDATTLYRDFRDFYSKAFIA